MDEVCQNATSFISYFKDKIGHYNKIFNRILNQDLPFFLPPFNVKVCQHLFKGKETRPC